MDVKITHHASGRIKWLNTLFPTVTERLITNFCKSLPDFEGQQTPVVLNLGEYVRHCQPDGYRAEGDCIRIKVVNNGNAIKPKYCVVTVMISQAVKTSARWQSGAYQKPADVKRNDRDPKEWK